MDGIRWNSLATTCVCDLAGGDVSDLYNGVEPSDSIKQRIYWPGEHPAIYRRLCIGAH